MAFHHENPWNKFILPLPYLLRPEEFYPNLREAGWIHGLVGSDPEKAREICVQCFTKYREKLEGELRQTFRWSFRDYEALKQKG